MPSMDTKLRDRLRRLANNFIGTNKFPKETIIALICKELPVGSESVSRYIVTLQEGGLLNENDGVLCWA